MAQKAKLKLIIIFLLIFFSSFFLRKDALASSAYVLPYPSSMPGSTFYEPRLIFDLAMKYWYFGDFGQFKYNLKQSDKYLVEARTLFEYKQYFLGYKALILSDRSFKDVKPALLNASRDGKNILDKNDLLKSASEKHVEELEKIKKMVPEEFDWTPEKSRPIKLNLWALVNNSINLRRRGI